MQLQLLIDACAPGLRELVLAGAWTGARLGELTSARVQDFDADDATLRVSGKTGARDIFLTKPTVGLLQRITKGRSSDALLFITSDGGKWNHALHVRPFAAAVSRAGLDPAATYYCLRHSYISAALVRGVPTQALADACGTSATQIERHYAKFVQSDRRKYAALAAPQLRIEGGTDNA